MYAHLIYDDDYTRFIKQYSMVIYTPSVEGLKANSLVYMEIKIR